MLLYFFYTDIIFAVRFEIPEQAIIWEKRISSF